MTAAGFIKTAIDWLYPPACPVCGSAAEVFDGVRLPVCQKCRKKLSYIGAQSCMKCGKQLHDGETEYCCDCRRIPHIFTQGTAVFEYSDGIKQSIYRFKYQGRREYASWYASEAARACKDRLRLWEPQAVVPVPLHESRLKKRGYNQAELIAEHLGRLLGLPVEGRLLSRMRKTEPMKILNTKERIKNLENAFIINQSGVKYKKLLLVDDIYTTGATMDACAAALKKGGVESVYFICLCIGRGI